MTGPPLIGPLATTHAVLERRRHTWSWALLGACLLLVGGIGVFAYSVIRYAGHDLPELIDDPAVVSTVDTACTSMTAEVAPWIVPVVDGRPITARMNSVGVCAVPATLVSLK